VQCVRANCQKFFSANTRGVKGSFVAFLGFRSPPGPLGGLYPRPRSLGTFLGILATSRGKRSLGIGNTRYL